MNDNTVCSGAWFDTIALRFVAAVVLSVTVGVVISLLILTSGRVLTRPRIDSFSESIAAVMRVMEAVPTLDRVTAAAAASSPGLVIHWVLRLNAQPVWPDDFPLLRASLLHAAGSSAQPMALLPSMVPGEAKGHLMLALGLDDGTWLTAYSPVYDFRVEEPAYRLLPLGILAVSATLVCLLAARQLSRPIARFATAAENFGRVAAKPALPESGPRELRMAIRAFNAMQARIERTLSDRLAMAGALSHDLRTPLARLRLRAEFMVDAEEQRRMLRDLNEMQALVEHSLAFLREDAIREAPTPVDLAVLLQGVMEDQTDLGRNVAYHGPEHATFFGRPMALKRAFANLVENAVKYGTSATVELQMHVDQVAVAVLDDGPGIPEPLHEEVFKPFFRQERSRNRATGGVGLGLAIARGVVRAHGGDIALANHALGGLAVTVTLPVAEPA